MGMFAWIIDENKTKGDDSMMNSNVRGHRLANLIHVFQKHDYMIIEQKLCCGHSIYESNVFVLMELMIWKSKDAE